MTPGDFIRRMALAQAEWNATHNGYPRQEGPYKLSALVRGMWHDEAVPNLEQAAERVRVFLSWGATTVKCEVAR